MKPPTATRVDLVDAVTGKLALIQLLDDVVEALELWQLVGVTDSRWVAAFWSRRVFPWARVELPASVRDAPDGWSTHARLLSWQNDIVRDLLAH